MIELPMSIIIAASHCLFALLLLLLSTICAASAPQKPIIVTSISPLALIARDLLGDEAHVVPLITGHASAHHFSLTLSDQKKLQNADSVIWVGQNLEQFLVKSLAMRDKKNRHTVSVLALLDYKSDLSHRHEHEHEHSSIQEHNETHTQGNDPHIWTSPTLVGELYTLLAKSLSTQYPHLVDTINSNADKSIFMLKDTHEKGRLLFKTIGNVQPFYVYHNALSHFIQAFDLFNPLAFTQVPNESISAKQLKQLYTQAKTANCLIHDADEEQKAIAYARKLKLKTQAIDLLATKYYSSYSDYLNGLITDISQCFSKMP